MRQGGGSVAVVNAVTDADGVSAAVWTLGPVAGTNLLRAQTLLGEAIDFQVSGAVFSVDQLAASGSLGCGLVEGVVWCWGSGFWASTAPSSVPEAGGPGFAPGILDASRRYVDLAVAQSAVCLLDTAGHVWCADDLAHEVTERNGVPPLRRIVGDGGEWPGYGQFCGLTISDSTAWCWTRTDAPYALPLSPSFRELWMSQSGGSTPFPGWNYFYRACGFTADSSTACWGRGLRGDGAGIPGNLLTVGLTAGNHQFVDMVVGDRISCARRMNGEAWCWGEGSAGGTSRIEPVLVTTGVRAFGAYDDRVTSLQLDGSLDQWFGEDWPYELGPPTGLDGVGVSGFAHGSSACAHAAGGTVYCIAELVGAPRGNGQWREYYPIQPVRTMSLSSGAR